MDSSSPSGVAGCSGEIFTRIKGTLNTSKQPRTIMENHVESNSQKNSHQKKVHFKRKATHQNMWWGNNLEDRTSHQGW